MGGQRCKTCGHAKLPEIHRLRHGGATHEALASEFGLSVSSLWRHFRDDHPVTGFAAVACAPGAVQAAVAFAGEVAASSPPAPAQTPPMRRRAIAGASRTQALLHPVARWDDDRGGEVVPFVRPAFVVVEEPRPEPVPLLKQIADQLHLGYTEDDVCSRLGIGAEEMSRHVANIEDAKRSLLAKTPEDWGIMLVYSCLNRLHGYRQRHAQAEAALKHREADRFDTKIVAAERELRKLLTEFGLIGRLNLSDLERQPGGLDDLFTMVKNSINGVFVEPRTSADVKQLRLG